MPTRGLISWFFMAAVFAIGWMVGRNIGGRVGLT